MTPPTTARQAVPPSDVLDDLVKDKGTSCSRDEGAPTAECLLGRVKEVRGVLRRKGFSHHAIEHAVTVLYRAAMPYINGIKVCKIENRRAWAFRVAINAAIRAAKREVRLDPVDPAILAATVAGHERDEELFDIRDALNQLTERQSTVIDLCILQKMPQRAAAKHMGIAVGTLCDHLSAAKERLKKILPQFDPAGWSKHYDPGARVSYTIERVIVPLLTA